MTALLCSRTLAQYSTDSDAGGLYCRVRNGTGCDPAAMAVIPEDGMSVIYIMISYSAEIIGQGAGTVPYAELCLHPVHKHHAGRLVANIGTEDQRDIIIGEAF